MYSKTKGFEFCFIPPRAPHFGGLWEAAVKATKTLVVKNLTSAHLTYEELQTLFLDVEAILNSRPIAPASDDPNDIAAVTPAHLLIGTSLTSAPEASLHHHSNQPGKELRYVDRWQRVTYLKQQFWSLWQRDYVHTLQQRSKWTGEEKKSIRWAARHYTRRQHTASTEAARTSSSYDARERWKGSSCRCTNSERRTQTSNSQACASSAGLIV
ncbi:hypothetical protein ACLKA7_000904 [Drosophila subpalustris]